MEPTDSSAAANSRSPRRELQGPRPAPLRVRKDSLKIKKPPAAPPAMPGQPVQPPRQPVIIYTVSPKVIHADPSNFMSIVQRLTGFDPSSSSSSSSNVVGGREEAGSLSPAARMAVQAAASSEGERQRRSSELVNTTINSSGDLTNQLGMMFDGNTPPPPGILSPVPAALPEISPTFFSPAGFEQNHMGLFHDFSPSFMAGSFFPSTSPGRNWDPFNQF